MFRQMLVVLVLASGLGLCTPDTAVAGKIIVGRVAAYSATSLSVVDKELITLSIDSHTVFTKMITQKPWQEDTKRDARALGIGRYVAAHVAASDSTVATWVQIATDMPLAMTYAQPAAIGLTAPLQTTAATPSSADVLSQTEVRKLVADANAAADHLKLSRHFTALAAKYDADAEEHAGLAKAYRNRPTASETKRPGSPDTATHCERLAEFARNAAKAARELARDHEQMAAASR